MKRIVFLIFMLLVLVIPNNVLAINEVNVYFFHSDDCSICSQEKIYLEALKQRYPNMRIYSYEISDNNNYELMQEAKNLYQETRTGVPYTVIGDSAYLGFSQNSKALFQKKVYEYSKNAYNNELGKKLGISYRNDLEGEVVEYKDNDQYQIEESSNNTSHSSSTKTNNYDKYKISICLVVVGFVLALIAYVIHRLEKRGRI